MVTNKFGAWYRPAMLFGYDSMGKYFTYQPTCDVNPMYGEYCYDCNNVKDGDSVTILIHGYNIPFTNEIYWQVYDPATGNLFTGDYSTTMTFVIRKVRVNGVMQCSISLSAESENVKPNQQQCSACMIDQGNGNGEGCGGGHPPGPPKPPPKAPPKVPPKPPAPPAKPPGYKPPGLVPGYYYYGNYVPQNGMYAPSYGNYIAPDNHYSIPAVGKDVGYGIGVVGKSLGLTPSAAPTVGLGHRQLSHYNSALNVNLNSNYTWFLENGLGATYYLTSYDGIVLYYLGTLCGQNGNDQACEVNMVPGNYKYRVDGLFDPDAANLVWEFCNVKGGASTELSITIDDDCECTVTNIRELEDICEMMDDDHVAETVVTLSGTFDIGGLINAELDENDESAIQNAINKEISDASNKQGDGVLGVSKLSWSAAPGFDGSRRLDGKEGPIARVSFEVKVLGERFGMKKSESHGFELLNGNMKNYLSRSMSAGVFVAKLIHVARSHNSLNLQSVNFARLINLNVVHETKLNEELSSVASVLVCVGALFGIVFGALVYRGFKKQPGYEAVARVESEMSAL
jgi:hypothetical protein